MYTDTDTDRTPYTHRTIGSKAHTATKPHRCDRCGGTIAIGERYSRKAMVIDGDFEELISHGADSYCAAR